MNTTELVSINCPYCGENSEIVVDCSIEIQRYIEDCQVCCQPITISVVVTDKGGVDVVGYHENEC